ncbi:MAG: hypothetical protein H7A34_05770 [bacterium]|nr:hypothetical protein [bacterium]
MPSKKEHSITLFLSQVLPSLKCPKKIGIVLSGIICSAIIKTLFTTIISKVDLINYFIIVVGNYLASIPLFFSLAAVSYLFIEEFHNKRTLSIKQAVQHMLTKLPLLASSLLLIAGGYFILYLFSYVIALFVKIPYLGELLWPIMFFPSFVIAAFNIGFIVLLIVLIHFFPVFFQMDNKDTHILKRLYNTLCQAPVEWAALLACTTGIGVVVFAAHYFITVSQNYFSLIMLGEKFLKFIVAIPAYPGNLLHPWLNEILPMDYVAELSATYYVGSFLWAFAMHLVICVLLAAVLTLWTLSGSLFICSKNSAPKE